MLDRVMKFLAMLVELHWSRLYDNFILKAIVFVYLNSIIIVQTCSEIVPVSVGRRLHGDGVFSESGSGCTCIDNGTYLVDERQCVNNQILLNIKHSS